MCGIYGLLKTSGAVIGQHEMILAKRAADCMHRRGPDDEGTWSNDALVFSFRRLSILDLSLSGHQPMVSSCNQYTLVFNGELYNYQELKHELIIKGYQFRSRSDSEVVLNALKEWGTEALARFNGMYAIGLWNEKEQSLLIARDHVGMKPLYYSMIDDTFVFGSQLDQILISIDRRSLHLDTAGLGLFLSVGYYPSPRTVFNEVMQVEPGKWMKIFRNGTVARGDHFSLLSFYKENRHFIADTVQLKEGLKEAVGRHLMSDVPIGTFLSGGLDSGIITAMVGSFLGNSFTAYTLSNKGTVYDEYDRASRVAQVLDVPHKVVYPHNLVETIQLFQQAYQEPFGDYSAIPSILIAAEARKDVKVMLSGDGSDEFFFGYNRMTSMLSSSHYYRYPYFVRRLIKKMNPAIAAITYKSFPEMVFKKQSFAYAPVLQEMRISVEELASEFYEPLQPVSDLRPDILIKLNTIHRYFQLQLLKLDRASMFNSIEARVPFADKDFMKYTIAYSSKDVTENGYKERKIPLQKIYHEYYPNIEKEDGPKRGFTIDMETMLKRDLNEYYMDMLNTRTVFSDLINFKMARDAFVTSKNPNPFFNWFLLSLQTWSKTYLN